MEAILKRLRLARMLTSKEAIPFVFASYDEKTDPEEFVARIPDTVSDKQDLMGTLAHGLHFPDYFGYNWDAITDCLRDLSWLKEYRILIHNELPTRLGNDDLITYIEILMQCVREWGLREEPEHELVVVFPPDTHESIRRMLSE